MFTDGKVEIMFKLSYEQAEEPRPAEPYFSCLVVRQKAHEVFQERDFRGRDRVDHTAVVDTIPGVGHSRIQAFAARVRLLLGRRRVIAGTNSFPASDF